MCSEFLGKKNKKQQQQQRQNKTHLYFNDMKLKKNLLVKEGTAKVGVVFFQVEDYEVVKHKVFLCPLICISVF